MWIFTKYGFFSVVSAREGDGRHANPVDPDRVMVRARMRGHLESLKAAFPDELGEVAIHESLQTDYRYRLIVDKAAWVQVMASLAMNLDYDNFKNEASTIQGPGSPYVEALHDVWEIGYRLQEEEKGNFKCFGDKPVE